MPVEGDLSSRRPYVGTQFLNRMYGFKYIHHGLCESSALNSIYTNSYRKPIQFMKIGEDCVSEKFLEVSINIGQSSGLTRVKFVDVESASHLLGARNFRVL